MHNFSLVETDHETKDMKDQLKDKEGFKQLHEHIGNNKLRFSEVLNIALTDFSHR